jgi:CDP-diacylglycerol--glycerol-3-phosphate 3-phosphatidyltransferase
VIFWRKWLRDFVRVVLQAPARALAFLEVEPATLTLLGLMASLGAGFVAALGNLSGAAWLLLLSGFFDMTDGQVARLSGKDSPAGAFLDSLIDRLADGAVLVGIGYFFAARGELLYVAFSGAALVASLTVSYAKARAENLIDDCAVGFWERPERLVLLVLGAFIGPTALGISMIVLTAGALWTAGRRALHTFRRLTEIESDGDEPR